MKPIRRASFVLALLCLFITPVTPSGQSAQKTSRSTPANELDAFMEKVLARREVNRQMLNDYILDEVEEFELLGPGRYPFMRMKREFTWYVRDGMHVRSPVKFNRVALNDDERKRYEENWIRRERERREQRDRKKRADAKPDTKGGEQSPAAGEDQEPGAKTLYTPRFVSEAYFMDFKFEPGNYYLAGREQLEGHEVLRIEYYPTHLFDDDHDNDDRSAAQHSGARAKGAEDRERRQEEQIGRRMNKTALITLWVDPGEHQIVKYTFDNVWLDFLPAAWLVRVDDLRASMTMGQPFAGVWLPRDMNIHAGVTLANGSFEAGYTRTFSDYREADVKTKIRVPKQSRAVDLPRPFVDRRPTEPEAPGHGPFVQEPAREVIREIRVHGNAFLSDEDVMLLAGVAVGQPLESESLDTIQRRLKSSGRFETVEVRKRYRSLTDTSDVALVLLVHERPGVTSVSAGNPATRPFRRLKNRLMFLPIISFADGYGFTYGGRVSTVNLLGMNERLSVPATWGGTRRVALELERVFKRGPLTRVQSSLAIWRRENPHFHIGDRRVELKGRAERQLGPFVRTGIDASRSSVHFGTLEDTLWTLGTNVVFDTRSDPAFPANAVLFGAGWTGLNVTPGATTVALPRINRYTTDARGYIRIVHQAVAAGRVQFSAADAPLPPYERLLLGGADTLRGFRAGTFDGDRMLVTSAELRVPITSVLSTAKFGVTGFFDASKAYDDGQRLRDVAWHRGVGAGIFIIAPFFALNIDVAHGLEDGDNRVHIGMGFAF